MWINNAQRCTENIAGKGASCGEIGHTLVRDCTPRTIGKQTLEVISEYRVRCGFNCFKFLAGWPLSRDGSEMPHNHEPRWALTAPLTESVSPSTHVRKAPLFPQSDDWIWIVRKRVGERETRLGTWLGTIVRAR